MKNLTNNEIEELAEREIGDNFTKMHLRFTATPKLLEKDVQNTYDIDIIDWLTLKEVVDDWTLIFPQYINPWVATYKTEEDDLNITNKELAKLAESWKFIMENWESVEENLTKIYLEKKEENNWYLPAVAFCSTIKQAEDYKNYLQSLWIRAERATSSNKDYNMWVSSDTAKQMFHDEKLDVVVTVSKVWEGWDVPTLRASIWLTPRNSPADKIQWVWRTMRKLNENSHHSEKNSSNTYLIEPTFKVSNNKIQNTNSESTNSRGEELNNLEGINIPLYESKSFFEMLLKSWEYDLESLKEIMPEIEYEKLIIKLKEKEECKIEKEELKEYFLELEKNKWDLIKLSIWEIKNLKYKWNSIIKLIWFSWWENPNNININTRWWFQEFIFWLFEREVFYTKSNIVGLLSKLEKDKLKKVLKKSISSIKQLRNSYKGQWLSDKSYIKVEWINLNIDNLFNMIPDEIKKESKELDALLDNGLSSKIWTLAYYLFEDEGIFDYGLLFKNLNDLSEEAFSFTLRKEIWEINQSFFEIMENKIKINWIIISKEYLFKIIPLWTREKLYKSMTFNNNNLALAYFIWWKEKTDEFLKNPIPIEKENSQTVIKPNYKLNRDRKKLKEKSVALKEQIKRIEKEKDITEEEKGLILEKNRLIKIEKEKVFLEKFDYKDKELIIDFFWNDLNFFLGYYYWKGRSLHDKKINNWEVDIDLSLFWNNFVIANNLQNELWIEFWKENSIWLAKYLYWDIVDITIKNNAELEKEVKVRITKERLEKEKEQKYLIKKYLENENIEEENIVYEEVDEIDEIDEKQELFNSLPEDYKSFIEDNLDEIDEKWIAKYKILSIERIKFIVNKLEEDITDFDDKELEDFQKMSLKEIENELQ